MQIHELAALSGNPASGNVLAIDTGSVTRKIDYTALAKAIVEQYNGSTLAGSAQTVQAAINALNTSIGETAESIDTQAINQSYGALFPDTFWKKLTLINADVNQNAASGALRPDRPYHIATESVLHFDHALTVSTTDATLQVADRIYAEDGTFISTNNWKRSITIPANAYFRLVFRAQPDDQSVTLDITTSMAKVTFEIASKFDDVATELSDIESVIVRHDAQTLTDAQKEQARENIGALAARLYISENALDLTQTDLIMSGKTLNGSGAIADGAAYALFKIPVDGIDGIGYQIYAPNSNNTSYAAKGQRAAMYDANGTLLGLVVNNTGDPAYVTNADCRWLYMSSNVNSALSNGQVMVLKNALSVSIPISECGMIPYESALMLNTPWSGRTWAAYGDSISAKCNGDFTGISWARYVNKYCGFGAFHGRSIGGQKFAFEAHGGSVSFVNTTSGNYNSRNDSYNYDNYTGTVPDGCTKVRGAFSSWLRITTMFPASIKDSINMVFIMGGTNDNVSTDALSWVSGSTVDPEWAASSYYATYGGDYNIDTLPGGVASTIMKFQAWMPNALIVIGTPCNGKTQSAGSIRPDFTPDEYSKAARVKEIAGMFGCPVIDVYSTCSINTLNSSTYITDGTHPSTPNALKRLSKAVIGGLNGIVPARD